MKAVNYDDPKVEAVWLSEQRSRVQSYLGREGVRRRVNQNHVVWFVVPCIAIWHLKSRKRSQSLWIISGDLPTDYLAEEDALSAREAVSVFADRWMSMSRFMLKGRVPPNVTIGELREQKPLGGLLRRRARVLKRFAADSSLWNTPA